MLARRAFISRDALLGKCSVQIPINFRYDTLLTVCVRGSTENPRFSRTAADQVLQSEVEKLFLWAGSIIG